MIRRMIICLMSLTIAAGCENTLRGQPPEGGVADGKTLEQIVLENRLSEGSVKTALTTASPTLRNQVILARMVEIDRLYNSYETAILVESRQAGFALSFANLLAGLAGGFSTGKTSQIYSLIAGGIGAFDTSFDKEILADSTIQAFISQMRANRAKVKGEIYSRLAANGPGYTIEAALVDLQRYRQAGTLATAIVAIADSANDEEARQNNVAKHESEKFFKVTFNEEAAKSLKSLICVPDTNCTKLEPNVVSAARTCIVEEGLTSFLLTDLISKERLEESKKVVECLRRKGIS